MQCSLNCCKYISKSK